MYTVYFNYNSKARGCPLYFAHKEGEAQAE